MNRPSPPAGTGPVGEVRISPDNVTAIAVSRWGSTHLRWHIVGEDPEFSYRHGWRCDRDVVDWAITGNVLHEPAI